MTIADHVFARLPDPLLFRAMAWQYRFFEAELRRLDDFVERDALAEGTAVDVGAWWGPWMYWLSRRAKRVVTVEPVPHLADFLRGVAPRNVEVVNAALSDHTGSTTLYLPNGGKGSEGRSSVVQSVAVEGASPIEVRLTTVDALGITDAKFVKIDVEGHEHAVLAGAENTLTATRPPVLIEIEARGGVDVHAVFAQLQGYGYDGWFLYERTWHPIASFDLQRHHLDAQAAVESRGYVGNLVRGTSHYVHNFVFSTRAPRKRR